MDYKILILGTDINAYTMARCAHELTGEKIDLIGKQELKTTSLSKITNIMYEENLWDTEVFKKTLQEYGEKHKKKPILLIATNDFYVRLISENKDFLKKWYVFNYPRIEIINDFLKKDEFYQKFQDVLDVPKTFIYSCKEKVLPKDVTFPMILKPGNGVSYYKHKFEGQSKVYLIKNNDELLSTLKKIEDSGYDEELILQEFIPGDDSRLFDCMFYVNSKGKAELATFAQIALQEHTTTGVGNCTVLMNGYGEFGIPDELIYQLKEFLESIHYQGFAEFDLKYDERDQKYKVFEINPRQARCSYYFSASTKNLVQCLKEDLIDHQTHDFYLSKKRKVLSFVPKSVIKNAITNETLKREILKTIKEESFINPLKYEKDMGLQRRIILFLKGINYRKKYKNKNWW